MPVYSKSRRTDLTESLPAPTASCFVDKDLNQLCGIGELVKQLSAVMGVKLRPMKKQIKKMVNNLMIQKATAVGVAAVAAVSGEPDEVVAADDAGTQQDMASAAAGAGARRRNHSKGQEERQDWGSGLEGGAREAAGQATQGGEEVEGELAEVGMDVDLNGEEGEEEGWGSGADEEAADDDDAMAGVEEEGDGAAGGGGVGDGGGDEVEDSMGGQYELQGETAVGSGSGRGYGGQRRLVLQESDSEDCEQTPAAAAGPQQQQQQQCEGSPAQGGAAAVGAHSAAKRACSHSTSQANGSPSTIKKKLVSSKAAAFAVAAAAGGGGAGGGLFGGSGVSGSHGLITAAAVVLSPAASQPGVAAAVSAGVCAVSGGSGGSTAAANRLVAKQEVLGDGETHSSSGVKQQQETEGRGMQAAVAATGAVAGVGTPAGAVDLDALIAAKLAVVLQQQQQDMERKFQHEMEKRLQQEMERKLQEQLEVERARHAAEREELEQRLQQLMGKIGEGGGGEGALVKTEEPGRQQQQQLKEKEGKLVAAGAAAAGDSLVGGGAAGGREGCEGGMFDVPASVVPAVTPGGGGNGVAGRKEGYTGERTASGAEVGDGAASDDGCGFRGFVTPAPVRNGPGSGRGVLGGAGAGGTVSSGSSGDSGGIDEGRLAVGGAAAAGGGGHGGGASGVDGDVAMSPLMVGYLITPPPGEVANGHQVTPGTAIGRVGAGGFAARVLQANKEEQQHINVSAAGGDGAGSGGSIEVTSEAVQDWLQQHNSGATGPVLLKAFGGSRAAAALGAVLQELVDDVDVLRKGGSAANSGAVDLSDPETVYVAL